MRHVLLAAALPFGGMVVALFLVACAGEGGGSPSPRATTPPPPATPTQPAGGAPAGSPTVNMVDFGYSPAMLNLRSGQQVTIQLTNSGDAPHTFTIDGVVDSGVIAARGRGSVQFTPAQVGTLTFYCTIHGRATMSGTINVTAGGAADPREAGSSGGVLAAGAP